MNKKNKQTHIILPPFRLKKSMECHSCQSKDRIYPRGTSNDAPKQIIVGYRLTIDCCFKISA
jgi:hypothetical protein